MQKRKYRISNSISFFFWNLNYSGKTMHVVAYSLWRKLDPLTMPCKQEGLYCDIVCSHATVRKNICDSPFVNSTDRVWAWQPIGQLPLKRNALMYIWYRTISVVCSLLDMIIAVQCASCHHAITSRRHGWSRDIVDWFGNDDGRSRSTIATMY